MVFKPTSESKKAILEELKGAPREVGRSEYMAILRGRTASKLESIYAHCYDCCGFYENGTFDCENELCALYPYMPYRTDREVK